MKCGLPLPDDRHTRWTPAGYEHEECPTPLVSGLHPSGFKNSQVMYAQLLVAHIKGGGKVNLLKCKDLKTGEDAAVLVLVHNGGQGLTPIARMFDSDGTDEVEPVMVQGEKPEIVGRKVDG